MHMCTAQLRSAGMRNPKEYNFCSWLKLLGKILEPLELLSPFHFRGTKCAWIAEVR